MTPARKTFFWIFGVMAGFGLLLGLVNLAAPDAVSVTWNEENVEGINSLWVGLISGAIPGILFGLIGAGIAALIGRGKKPAKD